MKTRWLLLLLIVSGLELAAQTWVPDARPVLDTASYDYYPVRFEGHLYSCGLWNAGDAIYRDGTPVLKRAADVPASADAKHACGPSLVATTYGPTVRILSGLVGRALTRAILLYYECAAVDDPALPCQICVAMSDTGVRWWRWSDKNGDGYGVWVERPTASAPTTAVIRPARWDSYQWYGTGHPSAMRLADGRIRVAYYDGPQAWLEGTPYQLAETWDGFHFWDAGQWPVAYGATAGGASLPLPGGPGPGLRVYLLGDGYLLLTALPGGNHWLVGRAGAWGAWQRLGQSSPLREASPGRAGVDADDAGRVPLHTLVTIYSAENPPSGWPTRAAIYALTGRWTANRSAP